MKDIELKKIKLLGGAEVIVDFSLNQSRCDKCNKLIRFGVTKNDKYMPIIKNKKGEWQSHFADCKFANSFRKK